VDGARIAGRLRTTHGGKRDLRVEVPAGGWLGRAAAGHHSRVRAERWIAQGRTSFLHHLVPDREGLGLGVLDVSLKHDDRMPGHRTALTPPQSPKPFLIEGGCHALSLCKSRLAKTSGLMSCFTSSAGSQRSASLIFPQTGNSNERQRLARLDQVLAVDLLAAEALQLFGDGMDGAVSAR